MQGNMKKCYCLDLNLKYRVIVGAILIARYIIKNKSSRFLWSFCVLRKLAHMDDFTTIQENCTFRHGNAVDSLVCYDKLN